MNPESVRGYSEQDNGDDNGIEPGGIRSRNGTRKNKAMQ